MALWNRRKRREGSSSNDVKTLTPRQRAARAKARARQKREDADKDKPTAAMLAIPPEGNPSMTPAATATAPRSAVKETRESISGPNARPASKLAGPPTPPKSDLKSSGTSTAPKGDIRTPTATIVGEKSTGATGAKNNPTTVRGGQKRAERQGKKEGTGTFIGKSGRKKAAVTKEDLEKSGLSLRDYLNKQRGLTRRKPAKKAKGGERGRHALNMSNYGGGGTVRGVGKATKGTRACKMVTMKGS